VDTDVPGPPRGRRRRLTTASAGLAERIEAMRSAEHPQAPGATWRGLAMLAGDMARLLKDLADDPMVPAKVVIRPLLAAAIYILSPLQVIPGRLRVIGHVDDLLMLGWACRRILRDAGYERIYAHWRGTDEGLAVVMALAGVQK